MNIPKYCIVENRGSWCVKFRAPDCRQILRTTGVKVPDDRISSDFEQSKKKAEKKGKGIVEAFMRTFNDPSYHEQLGMTLSEYIEYYLKFHKCEIKATTYDGYVHMLNKHIKPYFCNKKVVDIRRDDIEKYKSDKLNGGLGGNTVGKQLTFIKTVLKYAVSNDIIDKNPAEYVKKPKKKKYEPQIFSAEELQKLLESVSDTDIELPVIIAILFGLRRSEVVGLRWSNIDFDNKILKICETVTRQKNDIGKLVDTADDSTKTDASISQYSLTDEVVAYLKSKFVEQQKMARETDKYKDYVCINSVGQRLRLDYITDNFGKLLEQNGLPHIRFHDLRHSCISLLVNKNIPMKAAQVYARHANFTTTVNTPKGHTKSKDAIFDKNAAALSAAASHFYVNKKIYNAFILYRMTHRTKSLTIAPIAGTIYISSEQ